MNRRNFIKTAGVAAALPAIAITCKYEDDEKGPEKESSGKRWDYRVYCYEREQGEWVFSQNTKGSFNYQREYMTPDDDQGWPYAGWMDGGKLHFVTLEEAQDFVDMHVRTKEDINIVDSIYDIYYIQRGVERVEVADTVEDVETEREIKVAHYWFNGDTGRQIQWEAKPPYSDFNKIDFA
tara:strand:+ start:180 stop:719 length:540 start_codon:yes stop_codon:yes gene_type:complete